jgi:PhzF family phenazine biosynthesis protein
MEITLYQIDAFASKLFEGNPAAVCPLDAWLPDYLMQSIAEENNLSETAFFVPKGNGFHIRWFTPASEVDLCGHATLASAYTQLAPYWASKTGSKRFRVKQLSSRGGELTCEIVDDRVLISGKAIKYLEGKINIET